MLSSFNETFAFVSNYFKEVHAKRVSINEVAQTCSRVNEVQILCQLEINEGSFVGHKGWAEFDESHQAHLSDVGRVETGSDASLGFFFICRSSSSL